MVICCFQFYVVVSFSLLYFGQCPGLVHFLARCSQGRERREGGGSSLLCTDHREEERVNLVSKINTERVATARRGGGGWMENSAARGRRKKGKDPEMER